MPMRVMLSALYTGLLKLDLETCTRMIKIIRYKEPNYLHKKLRMSTLTRTLKLIIPSCRLKSYDGLFYIHGVKLWNSLPVALRKIIKGKEFRVLLASIHTNCMNKHICSIYSPANHKPNSSTGCCFTELFY